MQRRRIERLGRMAIQTACWCQEAEESGVPLVFASRHGDVARSMELLEALAADEPPSPTTFGLSVHNAIAALYWGPADIRVKMAHKIDFHRLNQ